MSFDMKYIDADKLKEDIQANLAAISFNDDYQKGYEACGMSVLKSIDSLQKEQSEGIEGVVHHYANVHYIITNKEQLNARLKDFEEGAEVRVFINARKEE